jgi:hypothetical protein
MRISSVTQANILPEPPKVTTPKGAGGFGAILRGAEDAQHTIPGAPTMALAVRGGPASGPGTGGMTPMSGPAGGSSPQGPGATDPNAAAFQQSLAQSYQQNMEMLKLQESVNAQNRTFTTLSNVMKSSHDTVKNAIGNIR